jgi:beta-xylosidase
MNDSLGRNPVLPSDVCIPDGEAHVFGDTLYVYGSRDMKSDSYCSEQYNVVSTQDMIHWTIHKKSLDGQDIHWVDAKKRKIYPVVDFDLRNPTPFFRNMLKEIGVPIDRIPKFLMPKALDIGKFTSNKHTLFAPDCIEKNGKYYLYFCLSEQSEGVAISDSPVGPFRNPQQLPCAGIDPAIFVDDDGKSYYYWGQFRSSGVELNEDMVSFDDTKVVKHLVTEEQHGFHEGSSLRKRNRIYYYVYPCVYREGKPTCLAYATAASPLGPFTYGGIIIDNAKCDPDSWNIHGSIERFHGQWYVFYHRSSNASRYHRRLCVEKIEFAPDGSIPEVKMTSIGAGEPFSLGEQIPAWRACEVDGGANISGENLVMPDGSSAIIRYVNWEKSPTSFQVDYSGVGSLEVLVDGILFSEVSPGIHEIQLRCHGSLMVHSITFE